MNSVWIVEKLDCCGGECDEIEGFVETEQEANDIVAKLNEKTEMNQKLWNEHCINCQVMCDCFCSNAEARAELEKIKSIVTCNCQELEVSEESQGDFYVICKRQPSQDDCTYMSRKIEKISKEKLRC